jgi:hypothetical protein
MRFSLIYCTRVAQDQNSASNRKNETDPPGLPKPEGAARIGFMQRLQTAAKAFFFCICVQRLQGLWTCRREVSIAFDPYSKQEFLG